MGDEFSAGAMRSMRSKQKLRFLMIAEVIEAAVRLARVRPSSDFEAAAGSRIMIIAGAKLCKVFYRRRCLIVAERFWPVL